MATPATTNDERPHDTPGLRAVEWLRRWAADRYSIDVGVEESYARLEASLDTIEAELRAHAAETRRALRTLVPEDHE